MSDRLHQKTPEDASNPRERRDRVRRAAAWGAGLVGFLVLGAIWLSYTYIQDERERALIDWQVRLGIVADSRAAALDEWLKQGAAVVGELAQNQTIQLFLSELASVDWDAGRVTDGAGQASYLRNLLIAAADRNGFTGARPGAELPANLGAKGGGGIALIAGDGRLLAASTGYPAPADQAATRVVRALKGEPQFVDMFAGPDGQPLIGFIQPVFGIQGDGAVGAVIGLRPAGADLQRQLEQPGLIQADSEILVVRKKGDGIEALSRLADGTPALGRTLPGSETSLAMAFAVAHAGGFGVRRNYLGHEVLVTGRTLKNADWTLVHTVGYEAALGPVESRLQGVFAALIVAILAVAGLVGAVWRHGASIRAEEAADRYKLAAERYHNMTKFMRVVADSQTAIIVAVDGMGRFTFANKRAADLAGVSADEMIGRTMTAMFGAEMARQLADANEKVQGDKRTRRRVYEFGKGDQRRVFRAAHCFLHGDIDFQQGALITLDDFTDLRKEQETSERRLMDLAHTLVALVDRRDPFSADHSERVAEVSQTVATAMGLDPLLVETAEMAGRLMNLGKIFVPADVLTQTGQLEPAQRALLADSIGLSGDILEGADFGGRPVVETLREIAERWDGTGPKGLKGEGIIATARVVALANAFVGMVSPRAWRDGIDFRTAADHLMEEADKRFDRKAVLALVHSLENGGGVERWEHFSQHPLAEQPGAEP